MTFLKAILTQNLHSQDAILYLLPIPAWWQEPVIIQQQTVIQSVWQHLPPLYSSLLAGIGMTTNQP